MSVMASGADDAGFSIATLVVAQMLSTGDGDANGWLGPIVWRPSSVDRLVVHSYDLPEIDERCFVAIDGNDDDRSVPS